MSMTNTMNEVNLTVQVNNIIWDTDSVAVGVGFTIAHDTEWLPEETTLLLNMEADYTEDHLIEEIADTLSQEYGFLVYDYDFEILD